MEEGTDVVEGNRQGTPRQEGFMTPSCMTRAFNGHWRRKGWMPRGLSAMRLDGPWLPCPLGRLLVV